jgi:Transposase, Mutator family
VRDVLIACCDGLEGLPEAIEATWPHTVVQTCVVHLIRAANRYVSYEDRKALSAGLRRVYTAADADAAETALLELADSPLGRKYPAAVAVWQRAWERFIPFLAFPPAVRRVIYVTDENVKPTVIRSRAPARDTSALRPVLETPGRGRGQGGAPCRTYDLDPGKARSSVGGGGRGRPRGEVQGLWGTQPCRAAEPVEGLDSRAPVTAATSTAPQTSTTSAALAAARSRAGSTRAGEPGRGRGCQPATICR